MDQFAASGDEVETHDGRGQSAMVGSGSVGAGRHGAGERLAVDVEVEFYPSGRQVRVSRVKANSTVQVHEEQP